MHLDRATIARARLAMRKAVRSYLFDPNVSMIDFGFPIHGGEIAEDEYAIRITVKEKFSNYALQSAIEAGATHQPLPDSIDGIPVDKPESIFQPNWHRHNGWWRPIPITNQRAMRNDPLRGGISTLSAKGRSYGTLGGMVVDRTTRAEMMLSNWHVFAGRWTVLPGTPILQPGPGDGGTLADAVGTLTRHSMSSNLDAAVATLNGTRDMINDQLDIGSVTGVKPATPGMAVIKSGRRSDVTRGRVVGVWGTATLTYDSIERVIQNVMTIAPPFGFGNVSDGGDSGSWWLDEATNEVVGLHFAGSQLPETGLAIDMQSVLDALNVDVVTTQPSTATLPRRTQPRSRVLVGV